MRRLLALVLTVAVLAGVVGAGWRIALHWQRAPLPLAAPVTVEIAPGSSLRSIAGTLHDGGVLPHPLPFVLLAYWHDAAQSLQAGEYRFEPGDTPLDVLHQLVAGRVLQHRFTIVEGWTFADLRRALTQAEPLRQQGAALSDDELMAALGHPDQHPEGRFLPETYQYVRGDSDLALLARAHAAMAAALAASWQTRAAELSVDTPAEALVLASIIEKETAVGTERATISGVFHRRLALGMRLQTDPTVIYGLGSRFDGDLRRADLARDGPYNTYQRTGLPPTPIALPGRAALEAAVHPEPGEALYFVARRDGTHVFSADYAAHRQAVACHQLQRCEGATP
ncbi:MAG: endolytic transglycosylase MltG [Pseudomonadota bacterium]|nr:endolytic transglycosylase MltG [Pseudomonadota bacterium]